MEIKCPQCNHKIPPGNDNCNLCGFEYKKHLQDKAKQQNQGANPTAAIVPGISFGLAFLGVLVFFLVQRTEFVSPEDILQVVRYFPIILPLIIIATVAIVFAIIARNHNK